MNRCEERIRREVQAELAVLESEIRERGARAGLHDLAPIDPGAVVQPRLQAMAEKLFGAPGADLAALAQQIQELETGRAAACGRVEVYRRRAGGDPGLVWPALPGWRRAVTVIAGAGFAGLVLVARGQPATWLLAGILVCLAAVAFVNAAGVGQAVRAALRACALWWDYRKDRWTEGRLRRRAAALAILRWKELARQGRISEWVGGHAKALEAEFSYALELGRKAREMVSRKTA